MGNALGTEARPHDILVVEDDRDIRETLACVLEDAGYTVGRAANGEEALEVLRETPERPQMILLDLMMPVMDGWAFRDRMLKDEALASIPVLVLTADGTARKKASAMHAVFGLTKPVHIEDLLGAVGRFCTPRTVSAPRTVS